MIRKTYKEKKSYDPKSNNLTLNPRPFLDKLIGKPVSLRVMSGSIYDGTLIEVSATCDVTLKDARELVFDKVVESHDQIRLLRGDVMYVRGPKPERAEPKVSTKAEEQAQTEVEAEP